MNPSETLLVIEYMTGQEAAKVTVYFDAAVGITGDIFTKLDGDPKGDSIVICSYNKNPWMIG